jgi:hypothetical protein
VKPLAGRTVKELPPENTIDTTDRPRAVPLVKGQFRCVPYRRYEVDGAGLVFWVETMRR